MRNYRASCSSLLRTAAGVLLIFGCVTALHAQYPVNYFRYPVGARVGMVANLGELRTNHWHMGLDIRTDQAVNKPVYAAADGYVGRIKVEPFGFGQAIYLNHPNGLTTVYAHLNRFFPALEAYIEKKQYEQQTWAIELELPAGLFPVKKGQFIANSGTTGGSGGPHVHFEVRNTATDMCINPLFFGLPFPDHTPPDVRRIAMYDRRKSTYMQSPELVRVAKQGDSYGLAGTNLLQTSSPMVSFAVEATDRMDGSANKDGIYLGKICIDDKPQVEFVLDSVSYAETRYMNAHIDYRYEFSTGIYLQHLSELPGYKGIVYRQINGDGIIHLDDTLVHQVEIEILDARKNRSDVRFRLQYKPGTEVGSVVNESAERFTPNFVNVLERDSFEVYLPEICLYDTVPAIYTRVQADEPMAVSGRYQLNDPSFPVHRGFTVRILPREPLAPALRERMLIKWSFKNKSSVYKASWQGAWLAAQVGDFGYFQAVSDTEPPSINDPGTGAIVNLSGARRIVFTPRDNYGIRDFRAELDGKWLCFSNDKGRNFIYHFDQHFPPGVHELTVTVTDIAGNVTTKIWEVKR